MTRRPTVVAAPDKFRGTATAAEVADAVAAAARAAGWSCARSPLADGGEGTLQALGGGNRSATVPDALGRPVLAEWRLDDSGVAVIEMSRASGLDVIGGPGSNDPVRASTEGTGWMISSAISAGASRVIVGVGGSATTDGGSGAVEILQRYAPFGRGRTPEVVVACDVQTTFLRAARDFSPQKGATSSQVELLEARLARLQLEYLERFGVDVAQLPGGGAAGGLAGGLAALGARLVAGFDVVAGVVGLQQAVMKADAVVTGEGFFDQQSLNGKVVGGVLDTARSSQTPVLIVAGDTNMGDSVGVPIVSLVKEYGAGPAWTQTLECIRQATYKFLTTGAGWPN